MPVLPVVAHLALVHPNHLPAVVAVLGEHRVEAGQTVRFALAHDVPLAAQLVLALLAGEVLHVPRPTLRLRALVREDDLVEVKKMGKNWIRQEIRMVVGMGLYT